VRAVNTVRKIARSFRDGYARFLHKSNYQSICFPDCVNSWLSGIRGLLSKSIFWLTRGLILKATVGSTLGPGYDGDLFFVQNRERLGNFLSLISDRCHLNCDAQKPSNNRDYKRVG